MRPVGGELMQQPARPNPGEIPPSSSAFNFFDVIVSATAQGFRPAGYEGGC